MMECLFCKIRDGEIPARKVYEDEHAFAFLDLSQVTPGHILLVPKKHIENIYEYDDATAAYVFSVLPRLSRALKEALPDVEGLNIVMNNGKVAYQSVFHSHVHLIPRYTSQDDFQMEWANNSEKHSNEELNAIQQSIQQTLEG